MKKIIFLILAFLFFLGSVVPQTCTAERLVAGRYFITLKDGSNNPFHIVTAGAVTYNDYWWNRVMDKDHYEAYYNVAGSK